jgi:hypothetical protein
MQISKEALCELIAIYKEEYGEELSRSEASEMGSRLLALYELLAKKLPNEQDAAPRPLENVRPPMGFHM